MTWTLRGDHDDVDTLWWANALEANVEAVSESKCLAWLEVTLDVIVVRCLLLGVWHRQHDDVCPLRCIGDALDREASSFCLGGGL